VRAFTVDELEDREAHLEAVVMESAVEVTLGVPAVWLERSA